MWTKRSMVLAAAFFCAGGWVCNDSAIRADDGDIFEIGAATPLSDRPATDQPVAEADAVDAGAIVAEELPPTAEAVPTPAPSVTHEPGGVTIEPVADAEPANEASVTTAEGKGVEVTSFDTVSLNVQATDLASVLQLLSIQGRRNIVPSPKVSGTVTANLYDVTFHEALDAILQQNGAGYVEKGNFIFVYTLDELKKIQDAERKVAYRIFKLNYVTAQDASTFVTPLLSSAGSIAITGQVGVGFQPTVSDGGANSFANVETMVVRDYPENIEEVAKVLDSIDTRPQQVLVEATILKADLNEDLALGVDMAILADFGVDTFTGGTLGAVKQLIDGTVKDHPGGAIVSDVGNVANGKGGLKVGIVTHNVQIFIRALDEVTDTTVVANPKIMTLNRQRAEVLVGEKIAYVSTTATATATTQTVEFLDTGTQLTVRPFVSKDGMIRMELKPAISSAELRDAGGVILPDETTQELTTNVMVPDGQTVVLGGLFKEETTITRKQVPGLGDIPILGWAAKGKDDTVRRSEVIFLITPHIVKDQSLVEAGAAAKDGIEQVRLGTRDGLLPWARSKFSAGHMRDALKAMDAGDREKALYEADLALSLDPNMAEARRLKEKLTGERTYEPSRSLLEDSVDLMIERKTGHKPQPATPVKPNPDHNKLEPGKVPPPFPPEGVSASHTEEVDLAADAKELNADSVAERPAPDAEGQDAADDATPAPVLTIQSIDTRPGSSAAAEGETNE